MTQNTNKRDMAAIRAAHRERMDALNAANEKSRKAEEIRKTKLSLRIKEKEQAVINRAKEQLDTTNKIITEHLTTLLIKKSQLTIKDEYGHTDTKKWDNQLSYFIRNVILKKIGTQDNQIECSKIIELIEKRLNIKHYKKYIASNDIEHLTPVEYEMHCAARLERMKWSTVLTKTSGDQGVDIIADKGGIRIAIQCKKYSSTVGNAAVQEIFAGMKFVRANYGMVVSNARYTPQARELAASTNILLLHHSNLDKIDAILEKQS